MSRLWSSVLCLSLTTCVLAGCATYDAPPTPTIVGAEDGVLDDPTASIVVSFAEPIDPATLSIQIVRFVTDSEGNLADNDLDPETELEVFFTSGAQGVFGGVGTLIDNNSKMVITSSAPLPVGPKLAVLIEKGLTDLAGNATETQKRLLFGYKFALECTAPSALFGSGMYFGLADIKQPLAVQVQLWMSFAIDPVNGKIRGRCTNADRNPAKDRCPMPCESSKVCRLLPEPACVPPSERAATTDEYIDYVANETPPTGYTFDVEGCVQDQPDGTVVFVTAPTDVIVQSPPVTLRNVTLGASFAKDAMGVLRGSGSLLADQVLLGPNPSGKGEGGIVIRSVPADEVPPGVPTIDP